MGNKYYNTKIIADVKGKYDIIISTETIRKELKKKEIQKSNDNENALVPIEEVEEFGIDQIIIEDIPEKQNDVYFRNSYAGVLILSAFINSIFENFLKPEQIEFSNILHKIIKYWLVAIIIGAKNFEQQRYLNVEDFEYICGYKGFPTVESMRNILKSISMVADTKIVSHLINRNIELFISKKRDFHIDGHFEEYAGEANILKGWNTKKNRITKGVTDYQVHTSDGYPVFGILDDQFYDFREIMIKIIEKIKSLFGQKEGNTYIYDRGAFSTELMKNIEYRNDYFVTWQKGFKQEEIKDVEINQKVIISFPYNDLGKYRSYELKVGEDRWKCKGYECRRIIIQRETEAKDKFCQSILTNDDKTITKSVIEKILKRFIQENDFKKQKNHFGLDEITSYRKIEYGMLGDKDQEKLSKNKEYTAKLAEIKIIKQEMEGIYKELGIEIYETQFLDTLPEDFLIKYKEKIEKIKELSEKIKEKKKGLKDTERKVSKLEKCKLEGKREFDLRAKRIMNVIKMVARNIVEKGAEGFLKIYTNLRDYQKVFRKIIRSSGEIKIKGNKMIVKLDPFGRKKFGQKCNDFFDEINKMEMKVMNGDEISHGAILPIRIIS